MFLTEIPYLNITVLQSYDRSNYFNVYCKIWSVLKTDKKSLVYLNCLSRHHCSYLKLNIYIYIKNTHFSASKFIWWLLWLLSTATDDNFHKFLWSYITCCSHRFVLSCVRCFLWASNHTQSAAKILCSVAVNHGSVEPRFTGHLGKGKMHVKSGCAVNRGI